MSSLNMSRPVPVIKDDLTFSRKKKSNVTRNIHYMAPRSPIKSAPPISRIFRNRKPSTPGAHAVSFRQSHIKGEVNIESPLYKTFDQLYFDQCFTKLSQMGTGSFGEVWKVQSKEDGKLYAVKKSRERFRGDFDRRQRLEEVNKSEHIPKHPNCVHFYKAWEELDHLYIQTDLCEMSLKDYAESVSVIEEKEIWNMIVDLCHGLKNLHDSGFVHLDIKPANLFLGRDGQYKIGDFGLVVELTRDLTDAMDGDSKYLAPEIMEGQFSKAADIFSLGITILELACSLEVPKGGLLWHELRNRKLPFEFTEGLSDDLILLISQMMDPDPMNRPTVDKILKMSSVIQAESKRKSVGVFRKMLQPFIFLIICLVNVFGKLLNVIRSKPMKVHQKTLPPPVPVSESLLGIDDGENLSTMGHESLLNESSGYENFYTSPITDVSPLITKKSMLLPPTSEKRHTKLKVSSPNHSHTPTNFCDSPECSPPSTILSDHIVRSRLFMCSSDDEETFEHSRLPKNLMSSFNETD